jgi:hypothetical protein
MAGDRRRGTIRLVTTYRIVVEGVLSDRFIATFAEMRLERGSGETWLTGEIADQAQLQGLITHIADLGLALRSVSPVPPDPEAASDPKQDTDGGPDLVAGGTR